MDPDPALKALAEPNRRAILRLVSDRPRSVGEIAAHVAITPQAVSQHLRVLREAGLVESRRAGTRHLFVVRPEGFAAVREFVESFWGDHLARLKEAAETPAKPQRRQTGG